MEGFPQNSHEVIENNAQIKQAIEQVKSLYLQAAEMYLEDGDVLKENILNYYSERPATDKELQHVLQEMGSEQELESYVDAVKHLTDNKIEFLERMEKFFEHTRLFKLRRDLEENPQLATDEEYELGVYTDLLESQVRDAVLSAKRKGYLTFQSGFKERSKRDQFMDVYNRDIPITEEIQKYCAEQSVEITVEHFYDRTTLSLHPHGNEAIRLTQWKEIWDNIIALLPPASTETVSRDAMYKYTDYLDFQKKQDLLRNQPRISPQRN